MPAGFNYLLADRAKQMTIAQWEGLGVKRAGDKPFPRPSEKAFLLLPAGARGPAFLMLQNFRVIMKYNPAEAYALAIGHLADRLRGGGPFVQAWPREERALSMSERFEMQQLLARRGYDIGEPDGLLGPRTRIAIRNFQAATGQIPDGFASSVVLDRLRQPQRIFSNSSVGWGKGATRRAHAVHHRTAHHRTAVRCSRSLSSGWPLRAGSVGSAHPTNLRQPLAHPSATIDRNSAGSSGGLIWSAGRRRRPWPR